MNSPLSEPTLIAVISVEDHELFQNLLPEVRHYIRERIPAHWTELDEILAPDAPLGPLGTLPLASAAAVGGNARDAIPVAAAWEVLSLAIQVLDEVEDRDPDGLWQRVGPPRAFNFGSALHAFSHQLLADALWPAARYRAVSRVFIYDSMKLAHGQDRELRGATRTIEDYWRTIEEKNGAAFALACAAGALAATDNERLVDRCRLFGHHLGIALQLFHDVEGIWEPEDGGDLEHGRVTLPLLYGLSRADPRREQLKAWVDAGQVAAQAPRIRELLDEMETRQFMMWAALQEREKALAAIRFLPGRAGVTALSDYVTAPFEDFEEALPPGALD